MVTGDGSDLPSSESFSVERNRAKKTRRSVGGNGTARSAIYKGRAALTFASLAPWWYLDEWRLAFGDRGRRRGSPHGAGNHPEPFCESRPRHAAHGGGCGAFSFPIFLQEGRPLARIPRCSERYRGYVEGNHVIYRARLPRYRMFASVLGEHLKTILRGGRAAEKPMAADESIVRAIQDMYLISMKRTT